MEALRAELSSQGPRMDFSLLKKWVNDRADSSAEDLCFMYNMVFVANKDLIGVWLLDSLIKHLEKNENSSLKIPKMKINQMLHTLRESQDRHYELKTVRRFSQCGLSDEVQAPITHECPNCSQHFETRIAEQYHKCNGGPCKSGNQQQHNSSLKENNKGVMPQEGTFLCNWINCNERFETKYEWRAHNIEHREEALPKNQPSKHLENNAGASKTKKRTRKRHLSSSSSSSFTSDEEFDPSTWRQPPKKHKKKAGKLPTKNHQGNVSRLVESENEFQSEFETLGNETELEMTNYLTSGTVTPTHGYTLRERINVSSRATSPSWLTKMLTRNAKPSSHTARPASPHLPSTLKNLKTRVEAAVAKAKKNHLVSLWDYTFFKYTRKHLVDDVLKISKHNFDKKYNNLIAETLYDPCKHLGDFKKFERRCFWLCKKFTDTMESSEEEDAEESDCSFSDCTGQHQNFRSQNGQKAGKEDDLPDHESVDLVTDADASEEDEFQSTSQQPQSQPASFRKATVKLEVLNGMKSMPPPTDVVANNTVATNAPLPLTKECSVAITANTAKMSSPQKNTQGQTPKMPSIVKKTSTSAGQQKDFLHDESSCDTMDFSLQVSDSEGN